LAGVLAGAATAGAGREAVGDTGPKASALATPAAIPTTVTTNTPRFIASLPLLLLRNDNGLAGAAFPGELAASS
jgi:hypothetical protein